MNSTIFQRMGFLAIASMLLYSCSKPTDDPNPPGGGGSPYKLSYGDSIIYVKNLSSDQIIMPVSAKEGTYIGYPEGIEIDDNTGAINVSKSETGLRYRITHISTTGDSTSTLLVLSGINFYDQIYNLSKGDSLAYPIYNANGKPYTPGLFGTGNNNSFDDDKGCNGQGLAVSLTNGSINLAKSLRAKAIPKTNDGQKQFTYYYRMDDGSQKSLNKMDVIVYYYDSVADIPQYLWDIINIDHAGTILRNGRVSGTTRTARPRPPCVIIVAN